MISNFNKLLMLGLLSACGGDGDGLPASTEAAITQYADIVHASYEDSAELATQLQTANAALVAEPSETTLQAAKDAWLAARPIYLQTEVYRF